MTAAKAAILINILPRRRTLVRFEKRFRRRAAIRRHPSYARKARAPLALVAGL